MKGLRFALAGVMAAGSFFAAAPAASADEPSGGWTNPAPDDTDHGVPVAYVETKPKMQGTAEFSQGIDRITFELVEDAADNDDDPCSAASTAPDQEMDGGDAVRVEFDFSASFPCNRRYQVRATVYPTDRILRDDSPAQLDLWLDIALPPAPTSGLTASAMRGTRRGVTLRWDEVEHEPDFLGYVVRRSVDGGRPTAIAELAANATTYVDESVPDGGAALKYYVVGARSGPADGDAVFAEQGDGASTYVDPLPTTTSGGGASSSPSQDGGSVLNGERRSPGLATVTGGGGARSAHRSFTAPAPSPPTTADTGFNERLPFGQRPAEQAQGPNGDQAVVRLTGDDGDDDTRRQSLLLVAGGTTAFSWAMLLRFLSRRAAGL